MLSKLRDGCARLAGTTDTRPHVCEGFCGGGPVDSKREALPSGGHLQSPGNRWEEVGPSGVMNKYRAWLCCCRSRSRESGVRSVRPTFTDEPIRLFPENVPANETALGRGPRAAIKFANFANMSEHERIVWLETSRLDSVLGSCRLSIKFMRSGYRCYAAFASERAQLSE